MNEIITINGILMTTQNEFSAHAGNASIHVTAQEKDVYKRQVEHHKDLLNAADYLVDMGPGAGRHGGNIVAEGTPAAVAAVSYTHLDVYKRQHLRWG